METQIKAEDGGILIIRGNFDSAKDLLIIDGLNEIVIFKWLMP